MSSIIKVNTFQDANGNALFNSDGSGNVTLSAGAMKNAPAFTAYMNNGQTVSTTTLTTIQFDTEVFDTHNCYDTSTYRFTPTVAGKYLFFANTRLNVTTELGNLFDFEIRHSTENSLFRASGANYYRSTWGGSVVIDMNGSTDYVYCTFYHDSGASRELDGGNGDTKFGGCRLIGV